MRPLHLTVCALAWLALVGASMSVGCAPKRPSTGASGTGATAGGGAGARGAARANAPAITGAAGAGIQPSGASGSPGAAGSPGSTTGTVPSGAGGTVDLGRLFTDAAAVPTAADDAGAPPRDGAVTADAAAVIPGDGNTSTCHIGGMSYVLVFTQKGTDVTMVATASSCAAGMHAIQIHGGFSCDNAGTEGGVWDGNRGQGIPMLSCANNKGTLTYTRSGADPATRWTVGDHNTKTDVTLHPMSVDTSCGTFF